MIRKLEYLCSCLVGGGGGGGPGGVIECVDIHNVQCFDMVVESMECFDMGVLQYDVKLVRKPTFCLQTNLKPCQRSQWPILGSFSRLLSFWKKKSVTWLSM